VFYLGRTRLQSDLEQQVQQEEHRLSLLQQQRQELEAQLKNGSEHIRLVEDRLQEVS